MDWIAKESQTNKFPRCKTLSHPRQGWSHLHTTGSEAHPEWGPTAGQNGTPTVVRDKRDGTMKSGSEFHALLMDSFNTLGCYISSYVKS